MAKSVSLQGLLANKSEKSEWRIKIFHNWLALTTFQKLAKANLKVTKGTCAFHYIYYF